jgi:hypothetical protein
MLLPSGEPACKTVPQRLKPIVHSTSTARLKPCPSLKAVFPGRTRIAITVSNRGHPESLATILNTALTGIPKQTNRTLMTSRAQFFPQPSLWNEIKIDSGELNRCELYLFRYRRAEPANFWARLLKQRSYQPQGWPTVIFENSIVRLSVPSIRMQLEAEAASPPPFCAHGWPIETTPRDLEQE